MGIDATAMHDNEGYQPLVANYIEFYCFVFITFGFLMKVLKNFLNKYLGRFPGAILPNQLAWNS